MMAENTITAISSQCRSRKAPLHLLKQEVDEHHDYLSKLVQTDIESFSNNEGDLKNFIHTIKLAKDSYCDKSLDLSGSLLKCGSIGEGIEVRRNRHRLFNEVSEFICIVNQKLSSIEASEVSNIDIYSEKANSISDHPELNDENEINHRPSCSVAVSDKVAHINKYLEPLSQSQNTFNPPDENDYVRENELECDFQHLSVQPKQNTMSNSQPSLFMPQSLSQRQPPHLEFSNIATPHRPQSDILHAKKVIFNPSVSYSSTSEPSPFHSQSSTLPISGYQQQMQAPQTNVTSCYTQPFTSSVPFMSTSIQSSNFDRIHASNTTMN